MDIHEAGLPNRAVNALEKAGKFKTIEALAKAKDEELLAVPKLGRRSIDEVRKRIARLRDGASDEMEWAENHRHVIRAIMAGELVIRTKDH